KHVLKVLTLFFMVTIYSCKAPYVTTNHSPQQLTDKQANAYIEEMYYQGIPQKCSNVEITDESIKTTFEYVTAVRDYGMQTSNSFANNKVESLFFKQIQSVTLNKGQVPATKGKNYVEIITRTNTYRLYCNSESLSRNFIDAVIHY